MTYHFGTGIDSSSCVYIFNAVCVFIYVCMGGS